MKRIFCPSGLRQTGHVFHVHKYTICVCPRHFSVTSLHLLCMDFPQVCAVHLIFLLLAVVALSFGSKINTLVCHTVSVLVSLLLLLKMIYQINYFVHSNYVVNCTVSCSCRHVVEWKIFQILFFKNVVSFLIVVSSFTGLTALYQEPVGLETWLWMQCIFLFIATWHFYFLTPYPIH